MSGLNLCGDIVAFKGLAFFCYEHPLYGEEVHYTDGTKLGTSLLYDIDPGPGSSTPRGFFEYQGYLFFFAENTKSGYSLWRTDGTKQGTKLIRPLFPSGSIARNAWINNIHEIDGVIFVHIGQYLVRTDGTYSGTRSVSVEIDSHQNIFANESGLFLVQDRSSIYKVNAEGGVSEAVNFGSGHLHLSGYTAGNRGLFGFRPDNESGDNVEVWLSDGTTSGTRFFRYSEGLSSLKTLGDKFIYVDLPSNELRYIANGTREIKIKDGVSGSFGFKDNRRIRFADSVTEGTYISDGTPGGTRLVPISFFEGGSTYGFGDFAIGKCVDSERLCSSNGKSETQYISPVGYFSNSFSLDGSAGASSVGQYLIDRDNRLWLTDGTETGTRIVYQYAEDLSLLMHGVEGQRVYYSVYKYGDFKLWHSDGTRKGTYPLQIQYEDPSFKPKILPPSVYLLLLDEEETN